MINTLSELRAKEIEQDKTRVTGCLDPLTKTLLNFDDAEDLHRYTSVCPSVNSTFLLVYAHTQTGTIDVLLSQHLGSRNINDIYLRLDHDDSGGPYHVYVL